MSFIFYKRLNDLHYKETGISWWAFRDSICKTTAKYSIRGSLSDGLQNRRKMHAFIGSYPYNRHEM